MKGALQLRSDFVIPKKKKPNTGFADTEDTQLSPKAEIELLDLRRDEFKEYSNIVTSRFSDNVVRGALSVASIQKIDNKYLSRRHDNFKKNMFGPKVTIKTSFAFLAVESVEQAHEIATYGLKTNNSYYSDLGVNSEGVYVFRHADLIVPHHFFRGQKVLGICFKISAPSSNWTKVGLGSTKIHPTTDQVAHIAQFVNERNPSRLDKHRSDQMYVFDLSDRTPSDSPASLIPLFIFELVGTGSLTVSNIDIIRPELQVNLMFSWNHKGGIIGNEALQLFSIGTEAPKPIGLDQDLHFREYIKFQTILMHPAIKYLFRETYWGDLTNSTLETRIHNDRQELLYSVVATVLRCKSKEFKEKVQLCKKENRGLLRFHSVDKIAVICIPPCDITLRLGLPYLQGDPYMYMLFIKKGPPSLMDRLLTAKTEIDNLALFKQFHGYDMKNRPDFHNISYYIYNDNLRMSAESSEKLLPSRFRDQAVPHSTYDADEFASDIHENITVFYERGPDYPAKGLLKPFPKKTSSTRKRVSWPSDTELERTSDGIPLKVSKFHDNTLTELRKKQDRGESREELSEAQKIERQNKINQQNEEFRKAMQMTTDKLSTSDLNAKLTPFPGVDEKYDRKAEVLKGKSLVHDYPMPPSHQIRSVPSRFTAAASPSDHHDMMDMEVESGSSERETTEPVIKVDPEAEKEQDISFKDPEQFNYDHFIMGKQESPTPIDDQIDSSNEMVKGSNVEEDDTVSVDPSPIEPQPDSQPKSTIPDNNTIAKLMNDIMGITSGPAKPAEVLDTPASPEPPASPPPQSTRVNSEKIGKIPEFTKDVDLRTPMLPASEPKIIPLTGPVEFMLKQKPPASLNKPHLSAFQPEDDDLVHPEKATKDKDERPERSRSKEKQRDRDDRDDRRRHDDRDRERHDYRRDRERCDRDDRDRRARDYDERDRRDRDYDRRRDRDDYRSRDRDRERDRDRRDRDDDRRRYGNSYSRDRDRRSSQEKNKTKDKEKRSCESSDILDIPLPSTSSTQASYSAAGSIGNKKEELLRVPSPVPQMFTSRGGMPDAVNTATSSINNNNNNSFTNVDTPASPPPPASPECNSDRSAKFIGSQTKKIPLGVTEKFSKEASDSQSSVAHMSQQIPKLGAEIVPEIPLARRNETWRQFGNGTPPIQPPMGFSGISTIGLVTNPQLARPNFNYPSSNFTGSLPPMSYTTTPYLPNGNPGFFGNRPKGPCDLIVIVPDDVVLTTRKITPAQFLKTLLEKMLQYSVKTERSCWFQPHNRVMKNLKANSTNMNLPQAARDDSKETLQILETYEKHGIVKPLPPHRCDNMPEKPHSQQLRCLKETQQKLIHAGYKAHKCVYWTPMSEGTALYRDVKNIGICWASNSDVMEFDNL